MLTSLVIILASSGLRQTDNVTVKSVVFAQITL